MSSHYSFLPWFRRGIAGLITGAPASGSLRAKVHVDLKVEADVAAGPPPAAETVGRDVELYGPGDITGIDRRAIIRSDPHDWITNFEPNYLAHIEFYDEDLPWRYSPLGPESGKLRLTPWIALVVLKESEFEDGKNLEGRPLPFITVKDFGAFQPFNELWAWAHVHLNGSVATNDGEFVTTEATALPKIEALLSGNPDLGYSRIVCPRKLEANQAYHAFLVPAFESGRRVGLGLKLDGLSGASVAAWGSGGGPQPELMPVYHRWYFRTGGAGDFEELVKLLKPRVVDARVGYRDMDVQKPGVNLPAISNPDLHGILKLGGALRAPESALWSPDPALTAAQIAERKKYDEWYKPYPHEFQKALAALINLADDYQAKPTATANAAAGDVTWASEENDAPDDDEVSPDPVVVPPLYGRWHAAVDRLLNNADGTPAVNRENWLHQLNLDPRHRVAASAGTQVIQKGQEDYMTAAWSQVGDVIAANRKLRWSMFALQVSAAWHTRRFGDALGDDNRFLQLTRPAHRRVVQQGKTVRAAVDKSFFTASMLSPVATRMLGPGGRLARLAGKEFAAQRGQLLRRLNSGEVRTAWPKSAPQWLLPLDLIGDKGIEGAIARGLIPDKAVDAARAAGVMFTGDATVGGYDKLPKPESLAVIDWEVKEPRPEKPSGEEAKRADDAARSWIDLVSASARAARRDEPVALDLPSVKKALITALDPRHTIRKRTLHGLAIPPRIVAALPEQFDEIMHHPVIDTPMYKPLEGISKEFLMPNLSLIPQNSITAVVTNQPFIEAYMVGLNHEFARELLWREYPTDQRGSVFRQFWDVKGLQAPPGTSAEDFREQIRDIPKIHRWPRASKLGEHDNREKPGEQKDNVVLVVRGELLKKYPNTVIYAQKAKWGESAPGVFDETRERELALLTESEIADANAHHDKLRLPLFEAKVDPDIYFFGFDLGEADALGRTAGPLTADNAGWFFVLKERPGEPRFGFDESRTGDVQTVNDLAWPDIIPSSSARRFVDPGIQLPKLQGLKVNDGEKTLQQDDDKKVIPQTPDAARIADSAARWAYVLYQAPVMVAVHAAEMMKRS